MTNDSKTEEAQGLAGGVDSRIFVWLVAVSILPATLSSLAAVWEASTAGQVEVIRVARSGVSRYVVSWPLGWARFLSPIVLGLVLFSAARNRANWMAAGAGMLGMMMWLQSQAFTTWTGTWRTCLASVVWLAAIMLCMRVGQRFGRAAAYSFATAIFIAALAWAVR